MRSGIVFVTAGHWQVPAIKMAKELGFFSISIDSNPKAPGLEISDYSIISELEKINEILEKIDSFNVAVKGVLSYCSEVGVFTAARIREHYNLGFPSAEQVSIFLDKSLQRKKLDLDGFINPKWIEINDFIDLDIKVNKFKFPLVVKPPDSSGSRGVSVVDSPGELQNKVSKAANFSKNKKIIIEEFIDGIEYTVEVAASEKIITVLLITRKVKVSDELRMVASELWSVNPSDEIHFKISSLAKQVFKSFGLQTGVGHLEVIVNSKNDIYVVEAAIRGGGFNLAHKLVEYSTGFDYCKWAIESEVGKVCDSKIYFYKPSVLFFQPTTKGILKKISGIEAANLHSGVDVEQLITEGSKVNHATTDADRIYCAIVQSNSEENLKEKKVEMQNMIKVDILV